MDRLLQSYAQIVCLRGKQNSCVFYTNGSWVRVRNKKEKKSNKVLCLRRWIKIRQTAYFRFKRISSVRRFLTEDTTKTLVTSYILSRLDCLPMGTPNSVIQPLQKIQNFAARLVLLAPRHHHSTPLLEKLHRLPISECIKYKVTCMCFSAISGSGPAYVSACLHSVSYTTLFF